MITVAGLYVYPVKSTRGTALQQARLDPHGLAWDRHWMVVDERGTFLTQRVLPHMARIVPEITPGHLVLRAPGLPALEVPLALMGTEVRVRVWKHEGRALEAGPAAQEWLTAALGRTARLVRLSPANDRVADPRYAGSAPVPVAFSDGFPILVCNQASLEAVNARLPQAVPMERFRPNVVIQGLPPFAEDHIEALHIGEVTLRLVKPCTRCVVPSIDQVSGEPSTDPTPVLKATRFDKVLHGVTFGENAVIAAGAGGLLACGSECRVTYDPA